jgi:Holliday junction resolvase
VIHSRNKGKRGERAWRDELRANGYAARRGQQFSGSPDSPDVICDALASLHFEVKCVERLNIEDAMAQARRDAGVKTPVVAHKRNHRRWLVTLDAEDFFRLLRGELPSAEATSAAAVDSLAPARSALNGLSPSANSLGRFPSDPNLRGDLPVQGASISAATCVAANSDNNKPTNKNETESQ